MSGNMSGKVENVIQAKYLSGHKILTSSKKLDVYFAKDFLSMPKIGVKVPYNTISNFETGDAESRTDFSKGLIGMVWKKKGAITFITFTDNTGTSQTMAFDFGNDYNYVDSYIKQKLNDLSPPAPSND